MLKNSNSFYVKFSYSIFSNYAISINSNQLFSSVINFWLYFFIKGTKNIFPANRCNSTFFSSWLKILHI